MKSLSPRYASNHYEPVDGLTRNQHLLLTERPTNLSNDSPSYFF